MSMRRFISVMLAAVLTVTTFTVIPQNTDAAKKLAKLNRKNITLETGDTAKLKVVPQKKVTKAAKKGVVGNNITSKVKWTSSDRNIVKLTKKKKGINKASATIKAVSPGKATIKVTIKGKFNKKNYKAALKCKVTVLGEVTAVTSGPTSAAVTTAPIPEESSVPTWTSNPTATTAPTATPSLAVTLQPTEIPKQTATPKPTEASKPTETPTKVPTEVPVTETPATFTPEPTMAPATDAPTATVVPAVPLVHDFENGINEYFAGRQGEEILTVESGGYNDNYCLKVTNRVKNWAGPILNVRGTVKDYVTYDIEAYVKHTSGSNRTINCMWDSTDYSGNRTYTTIKNLSVPTGGWYKIEATVVAPGDVKELSIYFEMQNYAYDFYIDNVKITEKHLNLTEVLAADSLKEAFDGRFPVGCSVYSYNLKNPEIAAFIKHHYSTITYGDELKPESLLNEEESISGDGMPAVNTDIIDKCLSLAKEHELKVRFHTLIWYSQTPDWFFCENYTPIYDGNGTEKTNITNLVDKDTMLSRMESYINQIITYAETKYPGVIYAYDVVNEAIGSSNTLRTADNSLYGAIFPDNDNTYITEAFRYAKEAVTAANSSAQLYYNDYVGLASPGQRKAVVKYLADAKALGYIDGLGMQAHQTNLGVTDGDNIKNSLNYFKDNGYEVQITELDFANKDNSQTGNQTLADAYTKFMSIIFDRMDSYGVKVSNATFWNLTDLDTWLNSYYNDRTTYYPSLFDENYMPKPAFTALVNLAKGTSASPTAGPVHTPVPGGATAAPPTHTPPQSATPAPGDTCSLNLEAGNIVIDQSGYTVGNGPHVAYTGAYNISGSSANTLSIMGGIHNIVLDNVTVSSPTAASPVSLSDGADVSLSLLGTSSLSAPESYAGINVPSDCMLTINGNGTLFATGGTSSAGIGTSATESVAGTLGKIIVQSGKVIAIGGRNGAGIGDGRNGLGGGEIHIYGGNIYAKSSGNGAGIGGGGSCAASPVTNKIYIYGGLISAGGSLYEIGDGRGQSHSEVYVYGGSVNSVNGKPLFGTNHKTADTYSSKTITVDSLNGVASVTVDGVSYGISGFHITDDNGTENKRKPFNLYVKSSESHTVIVTDMEGNSFSY